MELVQKFKRLLGGGLATYGRYPSTCAVCGRSDLKIPQELDSTEDTDIVSRVCPRCMATYCVNCLREFPKHDDGFGTKCRSCGEFSVMELSGKPAPSYKSSAEHSKQKYGCSGPTQTQAAMPLCIMCGKPVESPLGSNIIYDQADGMEYARHSVCPGRSISYDTDVQIRRLHRLSERKKAQSRLT